MTQRSISLSIIEKYLLKTGWLVKDVPDHAARTISTRAFREDPRAELTYPKPTYLYHRVQPEQVVADVLGNLGRLESLDESSLVAKIVQSLDSAPEGYDCKLCGQCCRRMRDAFQGLVSSEEVEYWRSLGQERLLRFVREENLGHYTVFRAWVNPKTGRYLNRCPWLKKREPGVFVCSIHAFKPLKCRAYPLSREQAEYSGCRGFEEGQSS